MRLEYVINHLIRCTHAPVRQYTADGSKACFGGDINHDPVFSDVEFERSLLAMATEKYPVIFLEVHPIYYGILHCGGSTFIVGPVIVDPKTSLVGGKSIGAYIAESHKTGKEIHYVSHCNYGLFCEEVLLLFNFLNSSEMTVTELEYHNFINEDNYRKTLNKIHELYFEYQEKGKIHNPYDREEREMKSISNGDLDLLLKSLDEVFRGDYAVLSKDSLRSEKNLAIIGLALASRAAIRGGVHSELAFSSNDSYILQVDAMDNIGEIRTLVRRAKFHYASMVQERNESKAKDGGNVLVEQCKNSIFVKMHDKILVKELAEELKVTPEYLSTIFKESEGLTIGEYIAREKVRHGKDLLIYTDNTITEIALYLGYCSQSHFGKVFRAVEGTTPGKYRRKYAKRG